MMNSDFGSKVSEQGVLLTSHVHLLETSHKTVSGSLSTEARHENLRSESGPQIESLTLHRRCRTCERLLGLFASYPAEKSNVKQPIWTEFQTVEELISSAKQGCHLCSLIEAELDLQEWKRLSMESGNEGGLDETIHACVWHLPAQQSSLKHDAYDPILRLEAPRIQDGELSRRVVCDLKALSLTNEMQPHYLSAATSHSTSSQETTNAIQRWLWDCNESHIECFERRQRERRWLPKRLLFVSAADRDSLIYLHEGSAISSRPKYATLSHCWGGKQHRLQLRKSTYERFRTGVSIDDLPSTFQHAIRLTCTLGLDYLWIDLFCIVQDSADDWAEECVRMSDIYSGSFINIAADFAADSSGGLYHARNALQVTPCYARIDFPPNGWHMQQVAFFPNTWGLGALSYAPLTGRAWATQERLLAPCTVHFLKHKVIWECTSLTTSENDPNSTVEQKHLNPIHGWAVLKELDFVEHLRDRACLNRWLAVLLLYTRGKLTSESDKLIAVSGIARYLNEVLWKSDKISYYAGLWSYEIEWQLLWYAYYGGSRATVYRAPTWSWASYNGTATAYYLYPDEQYDFRSKVSAIHVEYINDLYGNARSGYITICGPMCMAKATRFSGEGVDLGEKSKWMRLMPADILVMFEELYYDEPSQIYDHPSQELVLLGIVRRLNVARKPMMGLILAPSHANKGEYKRVGYFQIYNDIPRASQQEQNAIRQIGLSGGRESGTNGDTQRLDYCGLQRSFDSMNLSEEMYKAKLLERKQYEVTIV